MIRRSEGARRRPGPHRRWPGFRIDLPRPLAEALGRVRRPDFAKAAADFRRVLSAHPRRAAVLGVLGLALLAFVATASLPLALAGRNPDLAAILAPGNAEVLKAQARVLRAEFSRLAAPMPAPAQDTAPPADGQAASAALSAPAEPDGPDGASPPEGVPAPGAGEESVPREQRIEELRARIAGLADRILARAPLDAEAMRLKAEMETDLARAEQDMRDAYARSRREPVATFWLLNRSYETRDFADVIEKADASLRTTPALSKYSLSYLHSLATDPEGRQMLAAELGKSPPWRATFFQTLGDFVSNDDAVALFIAMKEAGSPPAGKELGPYLSARLFKAKDAEGSYNTWLQLLSDAELAALLPVRNTDFSQDPSGLPFDWSINRGRNVTTRFTRLPGKEGERALRIQFGVGRVRFGGVLQVTFMRPGTYLFSGRQSGSMTAKRGMKWQVRCFPSNTLAGESSQLFGSARGWQDFSFDFAIPAEPGCSAQIVRLVHDARSASEEYASGEIAFSGISVTPAAPPEAEDAATVH